MTLHRVLHPACGNLRAYRVTRLHDPWYPDQLGEWDVDDAPKQSTCKCELSGEEDGALAARAVELEEMRE